MATTRRQFVKATGSAAEPPEELGFPATHTGRALTGLPALARG